MILEKGLKEKATINVINDHPAITVIEVLVQEDGWMQPHVHRDSYEMYSVQEGKATIILRKGFKTKTMQLSPNGEDFCVIETGEEHMAFFAKGSTILIYRFTTKEDASVIEDIQFAPKLKKMMEKYI